MNGSIEEFIYVPVIMGKEKSVELAINPGVCDGGVMVFEVQAMANHYLTQVLSHESLKGRFGRIIKYQRVHGENIDL